MRNALTISRRTNRIAWLVVPILLMALAIIGGVSIFMAQAAPASPLSGHYVFRGLTVSGPKHGVYITGQMELSVSGTSVNGHLCGLNVSSAPSHCTVVTGTAVDSTVKLTINSVGSFPIIHATGTFTTNLIHKGATGFAGTYTVGAGVTISSGNWTGLSTSASSIAGSWDFYSIVQQGKEKGHQIHARMILIPHANDTYTGILCLKNNTPCTSVKGTYLYGYIRLSIGNPTVLTLTGSVSNAKHIASGQFYSNDKTSGDKGYWVMRHNESEG